MKEKKQLFPFHPFCIALFPIVSLYSHNLALFPSSDLPRPIGVAFVVTAVLYSLLYLILRNLPRAALVTSFVLIEFYSFSYTFGLAKEAFPGWMNSMLSGIATYAWVILALAVLVLAGWKRKRGIAPLTSFFNVGSAVLLLLPVFTIVSGLIQINHDLAQLSNSVEGSNAGSAKNLPDIYYIILDGYGREDALQKYFGYSNKPFIDALKQRGFFVADQSRSNYCQTELSLSSSLNMQFVSTLVPNPPPFAEARAPLDALLDRSAVSAFLKKHGYEYVAVTSGFPGVHPKSADVLLSTKSQYSLLEASLLNTTPFQASSSATTSLYDSRRNDLLTALANLQTMEPRATKPRFVFAHVLAPHPPFVIDANGNAIRPSHTTFGYWDASAFFAVGGTQQEYAKGYIGQLQYLNTRLLQIVDHLVKTSSTRPVIILQGDHGSRSRLDQNVLAKSDVREAFRNLNAYLVPDQVRKLLYPGITPVNSFRMVLDGLFGTSYSPLPDISYYSSWDHPYVVTDVTKKVEAPL